MFAAGGSAGPAEESIVRSFGVAASTCFERTSRRDQATGLEDEVLPGVFGRARGAGSGRCFRHCKHHFGGGGAGRVEALDEDGEALLVWRGRFWSRDVLGRGKATECQGAIELGPSRTSQEVLWSQVKGGRGAADTLEFCAAARR